MKESGLQIIEIEITNRCNLNCKHCYNDKKSISSFQPSKVLELIDSISSLGTHRLAFTGGEPLLDKNIFDYAQYAKDKKIPEIVLLTNGTLLKRFPIKKIKLFDSIQLSIDVPPKSKSHLREDYNLLLIENIKYLKKNNIKVTLQATLHRSLIPLLSDLNDFSKEMDLKIGINTLIPIGNAKELKEELLSSEEMKDALTEISKLKNLNPLMSCSIPLFFLVDDKQKKYLQTKLGENRIVGGCSAGISSMYIASNGDVLACPFLKKSVSNVFEENLEEIWYNNPILNKLRERDFSGKCKSCKYILCCGGCRAFSLISQNDLFGSDESCWFKNE